MLSQLIHFVTDHNLSQVLYDAFFIAGIAAVFLFNLYNCRNYGIPRKKALLLTFLVLSCSVLWMFFLYWAESGFRHWGGNNIVRIFIWVPVFAWPVTKLLKLDWDPCCDYLAPCACIAQGVGHFGCIFAGCCHGYIWSHGIYNPSLGYSTFPIQPIEALTALAVVAVVWGRERRNHFAVDGESYPLMLMLFGYSRFLLEFARDNDKLFLGISNLALHALAMGLIGTAWYGTVKERNRRRGVRKTRAAAQKGARA